MSTLLFVAKLLTAVIGGLVLLVALYFGLIILRKSVPFVFRSDVEDMVRTGVSRELYNEICGTPVDTPIDGLFNPDATSGFPQVTLLSWQPIYPIEGTASARIVAVGVHRKNYEDEHGIWRDDWKVITNPCEATVTFRYQFWWEDTGRAVAMRSRLSDARVVSRVESSGGLLGGSTPPQ